MPLKVPKIAPFKATRPAKGLENQVVVNSHLGPTATQLTAILEQNPFSYYHIFKPQFHFTQQKETPAKYFSYGKSYFNQLKEQHVFVKDAESCLYVYRIKRSDSKSYLGVIALSDSHDYSCGVIKKHEKTLLEKEALLAKHIQLTGLIGEPVLLTHEPNASLQKVLNQVVQQQEPCCEFSDDQQMLHTLWSIADASIQNEIIALIAEVDALYIADGHHRCASMHRFIDEQGLSSTSMLSFLVSSDQLSIEPFHRLVNLNNPFNLADLVACLAADFDIRFVKSIPDSLGAFDFVLVQHEGLYHITPKKPEVFLQLDAVERLNVSLLENRILKPCFGIEDSRNASNLNFVAGENSIQKALDFVQENPLHIAFILAPLKSENIFEVSDLNWAMPPKSTYIEPKLLSGMVILEFKEVAHNA